MVSASGPVRSAVFCTVLILYLLFVATYAGNFSAVVEAVQEYAMRGQPLRVRNLFPTLPAHGEAVPRAWAALRNVTQLREWFTDREVAVSVIPYAANFGREQKRLTVGEFLANSTFGATGGNAADGLAEPDYVFDSEFLHDADFVQNCSMSNLLPNVQPYAWFLPQCSTDSLPRSPEVEAGLAYMSLLSSLKAATGQLWHQYYLGPAGSGSPLHYHCQAFNTLTVGEKLWVLVPPSLNISESDNLAWGYSNVHPLRWLHDNLERVSRNPDVSICTQSAGETIFVPSFWSHATINLEQTTGYATEVYNDC